MCRHVILPYLDITLNGNTQTLKYTKSVTGVIPLKNSPESSMLSKKRSFHTGFILSLKNGLVFVLTIILMQISLFFAD